MTQGQESGGILDAAQEAAGKKIWVTLTGLPLTIKLEWPFHRSTSGADFWVLHGDIRLEGSEGLHAPVAVNLSQTVREVMPSLEPQDAEAPVINALRKEVDRRQIEFLKSGKLLPVAFSSRHYDYKRQQWVFGKATDEAIAEFVERKVYWETAMGEGADMREIPFDKLKAGPGPLVKARAFGMTPPLYRRPPAVRREFGLGTRRRRSICRRRLGTCWKWRLGWSRRRDCCGLRGIGRRRLRD